MLGIFLYAFNAIAPILILVIFGYLLKTKQLFKPDFFKQLNFFSFHYCFPMLMFTNLYSLGSIREINYRLAVFLIISIVTITVVSFVVAQIVTDVPNRKGVLIQAGFRSNFAVIGLPLAEGMAGSVGGVLAASMQAPVVIYFNFVSVLVLALYSDDGKFDVVKIVKNVVSNPMIQGLGTGVIFLIAREFVPVNADGELIFSVKGTLPWLYTAISYLGRMGTPLCLIALGGQFSFSDVPGVKKELISGVSMRLLMAPLIGFTMAFTAQRFGLLELSTSAVAILIAAYGSPIATSSAVMAAEMHADSTLAGQIVVWTCLLSMLTVFAMIVFFRSMGML